MRTLRALSTASFAAALALLVAVPGSGCSSAPDARSPDETTAKAPPPAPTPAAPPSSLIPQGTAEAPAPAAPAAKAKHKYAVATENATASAIAMDVLARGGSAVDAAIAGALAIGVVHPVSSGLGGGGFATVYDAKTKEIRILDFRETAPKDLVPTELTKRPVPEDKRGVMTGVPGEVAGIAELHARWGKLAMADLVRGAADTAEKGFPVSAHMVRALKWNEKWLLSSPKYGIFAKAGAIVPVGEMVKNPALAATLRKFGAEG